MTGPSGFLQRMRDRQADLFDTSVRVVRRSLSGAFNPLTASYDAPSETTVYVGLGLVRPLVVPGTVDATTGQVATELDTYVVKLPVDTAVQVGDNIEVTSSLHDAGMVGVGLRVTDVPVDEWQVCRRAVAQRQTERPT